MRTNKEMALLILQEMERLREEMEGFRQQLQLRPPEPPRRPGGEQPWWLEEQPWRRDP